MTLARPVDASARDENGANLRARLLALGRPAVMGVLNVTPDSFSDGGRFLDPSIAIEQAQRMVAAGADVLDIGAESTRPYGGAVPVPIEEEIRRLAPVLPSAVALGVPVSIDTMKAKVAAWALASGAAIVNDVWGLQHDGDLARVVANTACL
jgi:dihydropteroate synthase